MRASRCYDHEASKSMSALPFTASFGPTMMHPTQYTHETTRHSSPCRLHPNAADPAIMQCHFAPYMIIYLCTARNCCDSAIRQSCWAAATSQLWEVWIFVLYCNQSVIFPRLVLYALLTLLEIAPSLHRNLTAVEFPFILDTGFLSLLPCRLPSITPAEIVKLPISVRWKHKIPDRK